MWKCGEEIPRHGERWYTMIVYHWEIFLMFFSSSFVAAKMLLALYIKMKKKKPTAKQEWVAQVIGDKTVLFKTCNLMGVYWG